VLARFAGEHGGAARCTVLLCEALSRIGRRVTLFVGSPVDPGTLKRLAEHGIGIVTPRIRHGSRWSIPVRVIVLQLALRALRRTTASIYVVSLSDEARYLLAIPLRNPCYTWETTEALPGIQFVDTRICKRLHRARAVLVPSQTVGRNVRATYGFSGDIELLPFWVEPPSEDLPRPVRRRRSGALIYVGRMDPEKGFDTLGAAVRLALSRGVNITMSICGPGSRGALGTLAEQPTVNVVGFVTAERLASMLAESDALVLPSRHEGYPLALLEMCARGRPVIATRVGSIPEVFDGRRCAILVPADDVERLADAIALLQAESDDEYAARCEDALDLFQTVNDLSDIDDSLRSIELRLGQRSQSLSS
jgi:glycosyltransferase involved in cell wall biosynthesis